MFVFFQNVYCLLLAGALILFERVMYMSKKRKSRKLTVTQQIMEKVVETQKDRQHNLTKNQYIRDARRFVKRMQEKHPVTREEYDRIMSTYERLEKLTDWYSDF